MCFSNTDLRRARLRAHACESLHRATLAYAWSEREVRKAAQG
jgi:hypothetical protein